MVPPHIFRIQVDSSVTSVDPNIPNMDFARFSQFFISGDSLSDCEGGEELGEATDDSKLDQAVKLGVPDEEKFQDGGSLTSMDSGIVENTCKGITIFANLLLFDCCV